MRKILYPVLHSILGVQKKTKGVRLPSSWQELSTRDWLVVVQLLSRYFDGELSPAMVRLLLAAYYLGVSPASLSDDSFTDLHRLGEGMTFLFRYDVAQGCEVLAPVRLAKQFIPRLRLAGKSYFGYSIDIGSGMLTTDLTALQFIHAHDIHPGDNASLVLLALTLYRRKGQKKYDPQKTLQECARVGDRLREVDVFLLTAVALQFRAFSEFLFSLPRFSFLACRQGTSSPLSVSSTASLYDLCREGLGSSKDIEEMPLLSYLSMLSDKTISAIKALHGGGMKIDDIATQTGFPIATIAQMI